MSPPHIYSIIEHRVIDQVVIGRIQVDAVTIVPGIVVSDGVVAGTQKDTTVVVPGIVVGDSIVVGKIQVDAAVAVVRGGVVC